MNKTYFYLFSILLLSNCTAPTASLFGPVFTGVKTGSIYQASLSYGSSRIINEVKIYNYKKKIDTRPTESVYVKIPNTLSTFTISKVEFSDPIEPEPLP